MSDMIEPLFQPPARLQIMAALAACDDAEFATLRGIVEVSDSLLSKHLAALAQPGFVTLRKAAQGGRQRTWVRITPLGSKRFAAHLAALRALVASAQRAVAAG